MAKTNKQQPPQKLPTSPTGHFPGAEVPHIVLSTAQAVLEKPWVMVLKKSAEMRQTCSKHPWEATQERGSLGIPRVQG